MPTVQEVLKQSGFTDEQIAAFDERAVGAFTTILSTAEQSESQARAAQEKAELADRATRQMLDTQINPALDGWANEKASLEARAAYFEKLANGAKAGGFLPADTPFTPPAEPARAPNGQYVPGQNGSPQFQQAEFLNGLFNVADMQNEYFRLYGQPLPDSIRTLTQEASAQRMDLLTFAAKKYNFDGKRQEQAAAKSKADRDAIVKETREATLREVAEKQGSNPNTRVGGSSQYSQVQKAVQAGQRRDPLSLSQTDRRAATKQAIQSEIVDNAAHTIQ